MVLPILQDARYAARHLRKSLSFTLVALTIMGLGIGANTAIFSIISAALYRPLPYETPPELVRIYTNKQGSSVPAAVSYPDFLDYRDRTGLFSGVAAVHDLSFLSLLTEEGARTVTAEYYSAGLFSFLGLAPALGRAFSDDDDVPVVMLSHAIWLSRFGGDSAVLGQTLRLNGHAVTVVGVGPKDFAGTVPGLEIDCFMPLRAAAIVDPTVREHLEDRGARNLFMFARMRPGITIEQARAGLSTLAANLAKEYPDTNTHRSLTVLQAHDVRLHPELDAMLHPVAGLLMVVVLLVLLVACSNLTNLLLIRASSRRKEIAVRFALGASRSRLIAQMLAESLLLGVGGGGAGLLVACWTARAIVSHPPSIPVALTFDFELDVMVLGFTVLLSMATAILFGLAPALIVSRQRLAGTLKGDSSSFELGRFRSGLKNMLVTAQIALSLVLLVGAGLFLRSLGNGREMDVGFDTETTAFATVDVSLGGPDGENAGRMFFDRYRERIASSPGVTAVALTSRVPLGLGRTTRPIYTPETEPMAEEELPTVDYAIVTDAYFAAMGIPILRGRSFTPADHEGSSRVVIVSETLARRFWKKPDIVGERIMLGRIGGAVPAEVIGIARDTKVRSVHESAHPHLYVPFSQEYAPRMSLIVRTKGDPSGMPEILRRELQAVNINIPVFEAKTVLEHLGLALYVPRALSGMLLCFGALALALAGLGLYGVIAFSVARRTRDVGIRLALGAAKKQVLRMFLRESMILVLAGLGIGLTLSVVVMQPLSALLIGVSVADPITFAGVCILLAVVSFLASYVPARRAAQLDPMIALRRD